MNITTALNDITNNIRYFRDIRWKATGKIKLFPPSYEMISEDEDFIIFRESSVSKLNTFLNTGVLFNKYGSGSPSIEPESHTLHIAVYPDVKFQKIISNQEVINNTIPVGILDKDGNFIDARIFGGGASIDYINEYAKTDLFIHSRTDVGYYDGLANYTGTAILVEIPEETLNRFGVSAIESIVKKYAASGVVPVISVVPSSGNNLPEYSGEIINYA